MKRFESPLIVFACLLAFVGVATVCQPGATSSSIAPGPPTGGGGPGESEPGSRTHRDGGAVHLLDYLPTDHVIDATVDYSSALQAAIDRALGGTLKLPSFPILVSRATGQNWCVRVTSSITIVGDVGSSLVVNDEAVQLLRAEDVNGLVLRGFGVTGSGGDGRGLAHGLVQITGGHRVTIDGLHITGSDADGIAIANVDDVLITNCVVENASKAGIYVNASRRVVVRGNTVSRFGGHRTASGNMIGVGIQLSSNSDVICAANVIADGIGIGILCNALANGAAPVGNVISDNRIVRVAGPGTIDRSGGIRLANGAAQKFTQTVVRGNSIRAAGSYGIYVENHGGALVTGNSIVASERCGILIATIRDAVITGNTVFNSGTSGLSGIYQIQLINQASGVLVRDNVLRDSTGAAQGSAHDTVLDGTHGGGNMVFGHVGRADHAPQSGRWNIGDVFFHSRPQSHGPLGWICVQNGTPGSWRPIGN